MNLNKERFKDHKIRHDSGLNNSSVINTKGNTWNDSIDGSLTRNTIILEPAHVSTVPNSTKDIN